MKKILAFALLLLSIGAHAQLSYNFCLTPSASTSTDSVSMTATLLATDGYQSVTWAQVSGPTNVALTQVVNAWGNNMVQQSILTVHKLIPGTYVFSSTGTSVGGNTGTLKCTVTVYAPPAARMVLSLTIPLLGQTIIVPASAIPPGSIKYNDGTNQ